MFRNTQVEIDKVKEQLSNGNSRFENGKALTEIHVSELNKLLDIAYKHEEENYKIKQLLQGFLLWEEMFPCIKQYNNSHPALINEDYETYRKLISETKAVLQNFSDR
ncbi:MULTISPECIES: hypothetical protein [Bacillus cereus group]|uniref:hypothetical protein n=1 Tax=Bacillus cereus group TaxID=86661 RepID=UPI0022E8E939|nr:hypothetical protein [Bacillus cereus group sp. TH152-1LC]MDA1675629.1 hypothetical protein [Bacillus cereus group sp. TH152-1LC]